MDEAQAAHQVAVVVQPLDAVDDVLRLGQGEHAAGEGQAQQLHGGDALRAVRLAFLRQGTALHAADAAADVQSAGQGTGGVLGLGDMRQERLHIDVGAQTAAGGDDGHAVVVQTPHAVVDELGTLGDDIHVHALLEAHGHGLHLLDGHAAVGQEALEHGDQILHGVEKLRVTDQDSAAAGEAEFAGGEVDDVEQVGDHAGDLTDGLIRQRRLAGLDEVQIVLQQGGVQHGEDAVAAADGGGGLHVFVGDGLTADQVGAGLQTNEGDVGRCFPLDAALQRIQIDVALEGQGAGALQTLGLDQLLHAAAQTGDMGLGGGEVVVHDDAAAGLDKAGGQDVFTGAALVGGQAVLDAEQLRQLGLHAVEGLRAGVGIVGLEHGGLLAVGHGVDAGIRQHIQKDVAIVELKGVEACGLDLLQTLGGGQQVQLLDDLDLVHFHGDRFVLVKCNSGHDEPLLI